MMRVARHSVVAVLASTLLWGACSFGESGVSPPMDGLFLPTGLAVDPGGEWLFVVNSNSDLRYNAGTVVAVDLNKAGEDRARADWGACPNPGYRPPGPSGSRFCCRDYHDPEALNCDERGYVAAGATVRIGSFGNTVLVSGGAQGVASRRLLVAVRAEPSVTFIDAQLRAGEVEFDCVASDTASPNPLCDDSHKIRSGEDEVGAFRLPEEPYAMALDDRLGVLYVSHGLYGVSVVDLCAPMKPTLVSVTDPVFALRGEAVSGLLVGEPGNPAGPIYASGRYFVFTPEGAEVQSLFLRGGEQPCGGSSPRRLELVSGSSFFSSAFYPYGMDIRGLVLSPDRLRAYVLHRNGSPQFARNNPPALVAIDRSPDAQGRPANRAVELVEVCSGATELHWHDAGRGPRLYVVCFESGQVYVVNPELMEVSAVVNAGRGPSTLGFAPRDPTTAYLAGFSDNNVSVIDLKPGSPTEHKVVQRIGFPTLRR